MCFKCLLNLIYKTIFLFKKKFSIHLFKLRLMRIFKILPDITNFGCTLLVLDSYIFIKNRCKSLNEKIITVALLLVVRFHCRRILDRRKLTSTKLSLYGASPKLIICLS